MPAMEQYNDFEESLNDQSEGIDISCRKVSSNFSTCSSISFDMASYMLDGSFRSTRTADLEEELKQIEEEYKQIEEDAHWTRESCHFDGDYCGPNSTSSPAASWNLRKQSPSSPTPPTPGGEITGLEITTPVMGNRRRIASSLANSSPNNLPNYDTSDDETSVDGGGFDALQDDDDFTYETLGNKDDLSIALNDLKDELKRSSHGSEHYQSFSTIATMLQSNHNHKSSARDFECGSVVHEIDKSSRQSCCSYDDSTLYEVATLGTLETKPDELEQTVRKNNRTINTENNIHDLQDHIKDVMDALQGSFDEFTIYDEATVKTCESKDSDGLWKDEEITVSTFDVDSLVESQSSISFPQRFGRSPVEYEA